MAKYNNIFLILAYFGLIGITLVLFLKYGNPEYAIFMVWIIIGYWIIVRVFKVKLLGEAYYKHIEFDNKILEPDEKILFRYDAVNLTMRTFSSWSRRKYPVVITNKRIIVAFDFFVTVKFKKGYGNYWFEKKKGRTSWNWGKQGIVKKAYIKKNNKNVLVVEIKSLFEPKINFEIPDAIVVNKIINSALK